MRIFGKFVGRICGLLRARKIRAAFHSAIAILIFFFIMWYTMTMPMTDINLRIPSSIEPFLKNANERTRLAQYAMLLLPYVSDKTISYGKAAELLGISKIEVMEIYGAAGVPYYDCDFSQVLVDSSAIDFALEGK